MRSVKKETMDELVWVVRKYWATGDVDILDAKYREASKLSEQAYGSDAKWLRFCDIVDGAICLNRNVSNDIIYKIFGLLCIEVSAPVEAGADAETGLVRCGCGGKAKIWPSDPTQFTKVVTDYEVGCTECAMTTGWVRGKQENAMNVWNTAMGWKGGAE